MVDKRPQSSVACSSSDETDDDGTDVGLFGQDCGIVTVDQSNTCGCSQGQHNRRSWPKDSEREREREILKLICAREEED
jgi:hypothetical protein